MCRNGPLCVAKVGKQVRNLSLLNHDAPADAGLAPPGGTPTLDSLPRRMADFPTLGDALDYAARGARGMNFHDARGALVQAYPYALLREDALAHARRFIALGLHKGDRLALVAETGPDFAACFFGAVYAGLWPVPLPLPTSFGGREAYVEQRAMGNGDAVGEAGRAARILQVGDLVLVGRRQIGR